MSMQSKKKKKTILVWKIPVEQGRRMIQSMRAFGTLSWEQHP